MRRILKDNPDCEGLIIQTLDFRHDLQADFDRTIPDTMPPGFEPYIKRNEDATFEAGIRRIAPAASAVTTTGPTVSIVTPDFSKMDEPAIKTWAGMHGVDYSDKPQRGVLLARCKAKAAEVKK